MTHPLVRLGYRVTAVDESPAMLAWVHGAERIPARIEGLALRDRFDAVLLASHLVNDPDDGRRAHFLETCRRHVADRGVVLIEHHPADWAATATESETHASETSTVSLRDVRREPPFVSAVAVYRWTATSSASRSPCGCCPRASWTLRSVQPGWSGSARLSPTWTLAGPSQAGDVADSR